MTAEAAHLCSQLEVLAPLGLAVQGAVGAVLRLLPSFSCTPSNRQSDLGRLSSSGVNPAATTLSLLLGECILSVRPRGMGCTPRAARWRPALRAQSAWKGSVQCPALQRSAAPAALPQMEQGTPQRSGASPDTPSTTSSAGPLRSLTSGVHSAHTCVDSF